MFAAPLSLDYMASSSVDTSVCPEEDTLVSSRGKEEAEKVSERSNEGAGFFDTGLPGAALNKDTACAHKTYRERPGCMRSCSVLDRKQLDFSREASNEATRTSSGVRVAETVKGGNSDGTEEAEGHVREDVVDRVDDKEPSEEVEQVEAHVYGEKDDGKGKGCADKVAAQVNVKSQQAPAFQGRNSHAVSDSSVERLTDAASSSASNSYVPSTERRIELQGDAVEGNDSQSKGEKGSVMISPLSATRVPIAVFVAEEDNKLIQLEEGEQMAKDGTAVIVLTEKLRVHADAAETVVGAEGVLKREGVQQPKSLTLSARKHELAGAREPKPSETTATDAHEQRTSCDFRAVDGNTTARGGRSKAPLSAERVAHEESSKYEASESQEEAGTSQIVGCVLAAETGIERSRVCEEDITAVAAHEKSGSSVRGDSSTSKSKSVPVSAGHFGPYGGEQKSTPPATAAKLNVKKGPVVCARIRTEVEQLTSLSFQERGRSVVSSRRRLFERGAPAASDRQSPPKPLFLKKRDPVQLQGEQAEKETTTAAAKRGGRSRDLVFRKESLVGKLREKYEGSTSGSSVGSVQTQPPARNRALSTTSIHVEQGKPEPTWRRRQREKLQAAQEAAGQSPAASADRRGSNLKDDVASSGTADGTTERQDFTSSADVNNGAEGSLLAAGVAVTSETNLAPETYRSSACVKGVGYQMHRSAFKVYDGECSTVTSLKEKFERRRTSVKEERQQQTQQPPNYVQQQQQQQTLRHSAEAVTRLKAQYEQNRLLEENKRRLPCQGVTTTVSTPVAAKTRLSLPKHKEQLSDSCINQQHGDSGTASPTARTPVKSLKEQYQRLVTSSATASQRAAEPTTIGASTTVRSARELLGSVDIAGRYGKPYWMAKAERALKKDQSRTSAEELSATEPKRHDNISAEAVAPVATSTREDAHQASSGDGSLTHSLSRDVSHGRQSSERTSNTRRATVAKGDEGFAKEPSASRKARAIESRTDRTRAYDASAVWKRETPVDASLMEPQPRIGGCKAAGRSAVRKAVHVETRQSAAGTRSAGRYSEGEQSPTVCAHVSSKIGALASAIGPACINFGKAPPRRLLTRAEPEAETEETDLEIYGYSKAQEAIERRKSELKLTAKATNCDKREQGDACCADTTETTCSTQSEGRVRRSVGDSKEPVHNTNPPMGEVSRIVRNKKDENAGGTGNDGEFCNDSVTEPKLSNRGSSGEVDESDWRCAETERISSSIGRVSNIDGTEVQLSAPHADNGSSSSGTRRMLSTYSSEKLCGFSSLTGNGGAPSEHCPTQERSSGCWTNKTIGFNKRNNHDVRSYTKAPNDPSDGEAHPRENCVAFEFDQTSASCFSSMKLSDNGKGAPLSCKPNARYRLQVFHDERGEAGGASAEADESTREVGTGRMPPCKADCAAPAEEAKVNTEANEESFSRVSNGRIKAGVRKTVPARDEAQLSHVEDILRAEEETAAGADVLTQVDPTDLAREEQVHTSRKGLTDATEGESSQDFTSLVGGTMQGFSPAASVEEQIEEDLRDEQKEPVAEACATYEQVKASVTFASAREGYSSALVEAENNGGRTAAAVASCLQGGTSYEEEEVEVKRRSDKLKEAAVEGGISFRRVEAGNTRAIVVQDYAETENAEENSGRSGVAVARGWPEKAAPCFDEEETYPKECCPGTESGADLL